jgi:hypothetical protein
VDKLQSPTRVAPHVSRNFDVFQHLALFATQSLQYWFFI